MTNDQKFYIGQKALITKNNLALLLHDPVLGWDLPGGKIQDRETQVIQALKREVVEETQLTVGYGDPMFTFMFRYPSEVDHDNEGMNMYFVIYKCQYISGEVQLSHEHDKYMWIDKEDLDELKNSKFKQGEQCYDFLEKYFSNI